ncbi:auxin-responsive protein SAUR32-like [Lycium ferocissimum]|uniref:auxin-responsive protein SAUR32-like n=1 Tax=Lycium ferocissimum TaxID=112874 RepID=UPI00281636D3|nr:auxin-responsive protein SAUR32-like [Lycium ferocissimum]
MGGRDVPKGFLAINVGQVEEERQRFVVPVSYFNHPLFIQLLKEAEDEYGFRQKGTITIPCHVEDFRNILENIDKEHHHHHHIHLHVPCFRVSARAGKWKTAWFFKELKKHNLLTHEDFDSSMKFLII